MNKLKNIDFHLDMGEVAERYGIGLRTLERWIKDPALGFPAPMVINKRRFFKASDLHRFDATQSGHDPDPIDELHGLKAVSPVITDYYGLIKALKGCRETMDMSNAELEHRGGMQEGYTTKLEHYRRPYGRGMGPDTMPLWLGGLKLGIILVELPKATRNYRAKAKPAIGEG